MKKESLLKIIGEDELGLLEIKSRSNGISSEDRLVSSFEEINTFYEREGREPERGGGMEEHRLATRLESLRENSKKYEALAEYDRYYLLPSQIQKKEFGDRYFSI